MSWWIAGALLIGGLVALVAVLPGVWREAFPPLPGQDPHFAFIHGMHALDGMYARIQSGYIWMDDSSLDQIPSDYQSLDSICRGLTPVQSASIEAFAVVDDVSRIQYLWYVDRNRIFLFNLPAVCFAPADTVYRTVRRSPDMAPVVDTIRHDQFQVDSFRRLPTVAYQSVPFVAQTNDRDNRAAISAFIDSVVTLYSGGVLDAASRATADTVKARAARTMDIATEYYLDKLPVQWGNRTAGILACVLLLWCRSWIRRHRASVGGFAREYAQAYDLYLVGVSQHGLVLTHPVKVLRGFFTQHNVHNFLSWYRPMLEGEIAFRKRRMQETELRVRMEQEYLQEVLSFRKQLSVFSDVKIPRGITDSLAQAERSAVPLVDRQTFLREAERQLRLFQETLDAAARRVQQEHSDAELERSVRAVNSDDLSADVRDVFLEHFRNAEATHSRPAKRRYYLKQAYACIRTSTASRVAADADHSIMPADNRVVDASVIRSVDELNSLIDFNGLLPTSLDRSHVIWTILAFISPTGGIPYVKHSYTHLENIRRDVRNKIETFSDESFQAAFEWLLAHQVILLYKRTRSKEGYSFNTRAKDADEIGRPIIERVVSFMHQVKIRTQ